MLSIKDIGVESDAKVTNMGAPWNDYMLEMDGGGEGRTAFGENYGFCFVNVNTQFPFSEVSKKNR